MNVQESRRTKRTKRIAFALLALTSLIPGFHPILAFVIGAGFSLSIGNPFPYSSQKLSDWCLGASIVMLGFGMNFILVAGVMMNSLLISGALILFTIAAGLITGRLLGRQIEESLLISVGTAVCGSAAMLDLKPSLNLTRTQVSAAIGVVSVFNMVAIVAFPAIGRDLHLAQTQFGVWAGLSIHDVSSVIATGKEYGRDAMQIATAVKFTRVLWLLLITAIVANCRMMKSNRTAKNILRGRKMSFILPGFILAFLFACFLRQQLSAWPYVGTGFSIIGESGLTLTFYFMGSAISKQTFQELDHRLIAHGFLLWSINLALVLTALSFFLRAGGPN